MSLNKRINPPVLASLCELLKFFASPSPSSPPPALFPAPIVPSADSPSVSPFRIIIRRDAHRKAEPYQCRGHFTREPRYCLKTLLPGLAGRLFVNDSAEKSSRMFDDASGLDSNFWRSFATALYSFVTSLAMQCVFLYVYYSCQQDSFRY